MQKGDNCIFENSKDGLGISYRSKYVTCLKCIQFPALPINLIIYGLSLVYHIRTVIIGKIRYCIADWSVGMSSLLDSFITTNAIWCDCRHTSIACSQFKCITYQQNIGKAIISCDCHSWITQLHIHTTVQLSLSSFLLQALLINTSTNSAVFGPRRMRLRMTLAQCISLAAPVRCLVH
jgi:hypothetical protein